MRDGGSTQMMEIHLMPQHSRRARRYGARHLAAALTLGAAMVSGAQAAKIGHARVVSAPDAPLQVLIPLLELTPDELASMRVTLADEAAWQRAGLRPPTPLNSITMQFEPVKGAAHGAIRLRSTQALSASTVDILFDLSSSSGQRQVQISILVPAHGAALPVESAAAGAPAGSRIASRSAGRSVTVKPGDTLFDIAGRYALADADRYQMLAALWRSNPRAFIQNNMNLVRSGAALQIPDAAAVLAEDPAKARALYTEQLEAYRLYRARVAAQTGGAALHANAGVSGGRVTTPTPAAETVQPPAQDQVRLSRNADSAQEQADARVSQAKELADAQERIAVLQGNVDALSQAAGKTPAAPAAGAGSTAASNVTATAPSAGSAALKAAADSVGSAANNKDAGAGAETGAAQSAVEAAAPLANAPLGPVTASTPSAEPAAVVNTQTYPESDQDWTDRLPSWLTDNLLVIVTGSLAFIVFVLAWLLRRAGARRADEEEAYSVAEGLYSEDAYDDYEQTGSLDPAMLSRKLDSIDLDLAHPPSDGSYSHGRPRA